MAKSIRLIKENLKLVDIVIELRDARIPESSKNPEIDGFIGEKKRVIAFTKSDLADYDISDKWMNWYKKKDQDCVFIDANSGKGIDAVKKMLTSQMKERIALDIEKGRIHRPIRTMVVGIPNVGKSTFINRIAGRNVAQTGDRPGVTTGKQWIRINKDIELLDTPGILWPKFEDDEVAKNLAYTGAIKDEIMDIAELSGDLLKKLLIIYPDKVKERYKIGENLDRELSAVGEKPGIELLEEAGKKRGCLIKGGEIDLYRIAAIILDEVRGGKLGRISFEIPISP